MSNSHQLAERLREVFLSGKWIANTNYKEQLEQIDFEEAITKVENLNSIALLVYHINYYLGGINQVFHGGSLDIRDQFSFDMPEITSQQDWLELKQSFYKNVEIFIGCVENFDEHILKCSFVSDKYGTYLRNIDGMIEHSYYHLGQIVLISKVIKKNRQKSKAPNP